MCAGGQGVGVLFFYFTDVSMNPKQCLAPSVYMRAKSLQMHPTLCSPMDITPSSSIHEIL